ncbi:hypothetical protein, partial [Burkholderia cenocepacia]|uniref:hypothetical protein n=1 Tax=Burkholderia cenocepacia TaxID=95486 RepID=UPI001E5C9AED
MTGKLDKTTDITTYGVGRDKTQAMPCASAEWNHATIQMKKPAQGGLFHFLAERTGLAYLPQAAAAL